MMMMTSASSTSIMKAKVTSNSTPTTHLPPRKRARMEQDADPFKSLGSLTFRIDNFREFSRSSPREANKRHCDTKVSVRGLTFGLAILPVRCTSKKDSTQKCMCMGISVKCENTSGCNVEGDGSWSCMASMTFRIKSLLKSRRGDIFEFPFTHWFFYSKEKSSLECGTPFSFSFLFDPKYGLYNEEEDTLELLTEISVDAPAGIMELPKTDAIQINEETVFINKHLLAAHSPYFHSMFYNAQFDEGKSGEYKVKIEAPGTVEHFKWMLQTLYPENRPLDDQCIEGVLHVSNQFLMATVEGKCLRFLMEESTKPPLFKYRMADKYGFIALKNHVLDNLKFEEFGKRMFKDNMAEYVQLGPNAAQVLMARYDELFTPKSKKKPAQSQ